MEEHVKMVPSLCTQCGGTVEVDEKAETAKCPFCGTTFVVEKAINNYNVKYATIEHADNVNTDVTGAVREVLEFAGDQIKESRQERQEQRKEEAERSRMFQSAFLKIFGLMMAGMFLICAIYFFYMLFTGKFEENDETSSGTGESVITCEINNGNLDISVEGDNIGEWKFQEFDSIGCTLGYESNDISGYNCEVYPRSVFTDEESTGYVVNAVCGGNNDEPEYYCIVRFITDGTAILEAEDPVYVDSLSEYVFE